MMKSGATTRLGFDMQGKTPAELEQHLQGGVRKEEEEEEEEEEGETEEVLAARYQGKESYLPWVDVSELGTRSMQ
ncbi:hypothetical protein NHJ13051_002890 [Beauveria bassiana]